MGKGNFILDKNTTLYYSEDAVKNICLQFNNSLQNQYGFTLPIKYAAADEITKIKNKNISVVLFPKLVKAADIPGYYLLNVYENSIQLVSMEEQGLFYGLQTMLQLLPVKAKTSNQKNYLLSEVS